MALRDLPTYSERVARLEAVLFARRELAWAKREVTRIESARPTEPEYDAYALGWVNGRFYGVRWIYEKLRRDAVDYAREFKRATRAVAVDRESAQIARWSRSGG